MTNNNMAALVKAGARSWNEWKTSSTKELRILDGIQLADLDLKGIDFSGLSMQRSRINGCNLRSAKFIASNLSHSDLRGNDFSGTRFIAATLDGADLSDSNLTGASFLTASVRGAKLARLDFRGHDLRSLDLRDTSLASSNLTSQMLADMDLSGVDLSGANLSDADLSNANLSRANLKNANLSGARLQGANFRGANLEEVDLRGRDLAGADFEGASLLNCDLREASLKNASLANCDISGSRLWKIQARNWNIAGIKCRDAYWEKSGTIKTQYRNREFERIYAENPTVELHYPYRLMGTELVTLPILIEHLEATFWGIDLRLKSVEEIAGGTRVTLVIDERGKHSPSELKEELQNEATKIQMAQLSLRRNTLLQGQLKEEVANIKEKFWPRLLELSADYEREHVRNLTVVFMDLKGFSQWADDELSDKLSLFRGLVKPILNKWQAGYPNMEGDSLRVTFRNASAGLACACTMRGVLTAAGFEVRIGVELGEVTVIHNEITDISDLEGTSISMAARLETIAVPGQVLATERIRHYADHKGLFEFTPVKTALGKGIGDKSAGDIIECYAVTMNPAAHDSI
jgi:uncharacterized protein YjbI with pentapeptide repeats/class 3 adenylate cyclase